MKKSSSKRRNLKTLVNLVQSDFFCTNVFTNVKHLEYNIFILIGAFGEYFSLFLTI